MLLQYEVLLRYDLLSMNSKQTIFKQDLQLFLLDHNFSIFSLSAYVPQMHLTYYLIYKLFIERAFLMNLDQYLSLVCLAHSQTPQPKHGQGAHITQQEKFYHYQTLKRWMGKYERQNPYIVNHLQCECQEQTHKSTKNTPPNREKQAILKQGYELPQKQNKDQNQDNETRDQNLIAIAFLKRIKVLFQSDRIYLKRIIKRLKMDIPIKQLKVWLQQHSLQSYGKKQIQYVKSLINCCNQKSIILRILLKEFLEVSTRLSILTKKRQERHDLRAKLGLVRKIKESLFKEEV